MHGLQPIQNPFPSPNDWQASRQGSKQTAKAGIAATEKMLRAFPDYGKAPDGYLLSISELLAGYSENIRRKLCDLKTGIPSKTSYLPTVEQITKLADVFIEQEERLERYRSAPRRPVRVEPPQRYTPFPKLWDEFGHDFLVGRTFEVLSEASRRLAMKGSAAAQEYLEGQVQT